MLQKFFQTPQLTEDHRKARELARASIGWPAYDGILGRTLGLHFLYVRKYVPFIVLIGTVLVSLSFGLVAYFDESINSSYYKYRCYPDGERAGSLGSCLDPGAHVHSVPGKKSNAGRSSQFILMVTFAVVFILLNVYLVHRWKYYFFKSAAKDVHRDYQEIQMSDGMISSQVVDRNVRRNAARIIWRGKHKRYWTVMLLPDSLIFGTFLTPLGKTYLQYLYAGLQLSGVIFAGVFAGIARPLDEAWRCYPDSSMKAVTQGMCNDPKAKLDDVFQVSKNHHTTFFWATLGGMATSFFLVLVMYLVCATKYSKWYFNYLESHRKHLMGIFNFLKSDQYVY